MSNESITHLIQAAREARQFARADYSHYPVGAALECADRRIFTGVNVESSSYGLTICAERVALFKALSAGADHFTRLVVVTDSEPPAAPCGACRQLLWDYAREVEIYLIGKSGEPVRTTMAELLPRAFGKEQL